MMAHAPDKIFNIAGFPFQGDRIFIKIPSFQRAGNEEPPRHLPRQEADNQFEMILFRQIAEEFEPFHHPFVNPRKRGRIFRRVPAAVRFPDGKIFRKRQSGELLKIVPGRKYPQKSESVFCKEGQILFDLLLLPVSPHPSGRLRCPVVDAKSQCSAFKHVPPILVFL